MQEKLIHYSSKMRDLILEAEAEGVVLSTGKLLAECLQDPDIRHNYPASVESHKLLMIATQMPLSRLPDVFGGQHHFVKAEAMQFTKKDGSLEFAIPGPEKPNGFPIIPIHRPGINDHLFVDSDLLAPVAVLVKEVGIAYSTTALRFGTEFNLLSISSDDHLLDVGLQDQTDVLDSKVTLSSIYVNVAENVFKIDAHNHAETSAHYEVDNKPGANYQDMVLNYNNILTIDCNTQLASLPNDKTELVKQFLSGGTLKLFVNVMGKINLQFGVTAAVARHVAGVEIKAVTPEALEASEQLSHYLSQATIALEGYSLDATRVNLNRRPG